ncbi:MAG: exodeoxyribonuclease V subunit alpha [Chthoniobacteraceae bacterium]|nr:exodeoxyribonuclease V subunit alpha [Chthoniobacteraceae bacterium]
MKTPYAKTQRREAGLDSPAFAELDRHFARFIARFGGGEPVALAAAHLSRAVRQGHICLDLARAPLSDAGEPLPWLPLEEWRAALRASRAVGAPTDTATPLVLDAAGRLYLRRYFAYETALADALLLRAARAPGEGIAEEQEAAVERAVASPLTLLSGGPGTGKTTTAARILLRLMPPGAPLPRLALAAPTGKAAARLEEALRASLVRHERPDLLAALPRAGTLHRLLGIRPGVARPRHDAAHPLALDMLVVDEASMVPLPLMAKLFDALPSTARVLLLGDRDQLASVDPGNVLADMVDAATAPGSPLRGTLAVLRKNYRFGNASAIYRLCETVRAGKAAEALALLREFASGAESDFGGELGGGPLPALPKLDAALHGPALAGYGPLVRERDPARALELLGRFRILCAVRKGPYGVEEINRRAAALLRREAAIAENVPLAGTPLLVTENAPQLNLFNGDTGVLLPDPAEPGGPLWAWFPGEGTAPRRIAPAQLPAHEPAFAMTVHKSQGSEFDRVLLVLPERDSPVLTRELIYTGLTRARHRVDLWAEPGVLERAVERRTERTSGLRERLAGDC